MMEDPETCSACTDPLDAMPVSWQHQLIQMLPAQDKLSLFQTCKALARQVVQSAPSVVLHLIDLGQDEQTAARNQHTRCAAITGLLSACSSFKLRLDLQPHQPVPVTLFEHITSLDIKLEQSLPGAILIGAELAPAYQAAINVLAWPSMNSLQVLSIPGSIGWDALTRLCTALEAGQLQQLRSFTFRQCSGSGVSDELQQRLARVLGPRLTHLTTDAVGLLAHLSCMTALQSISIATDKIRLATARLLCEHPTLRSVGLYGCIAIEGDHSQCACQWETLSINTHNPHVLTVLPLHGLHEIRIVGLARCSNGYYREAVHMVLHQHKDKIVCVPKMTFTSIRCLHEPVFEFWGVHEESVQLARCLRGTCTVHVCGIVARPPLLRMLWAALPPDVHAIGLFDVSGVTWDHVWDGLPHTVTHVDMASLPWAAMCHLVLTCPAHVRSMAVAVKRLDSALLHSIAPAHVDLKFG